MTNHLKKPINLVHDNIAVLFPRQDRELSMMMDSWFKENFYRLVADFFYDDVLRKEYFCRWTEHLKKKGNGSRNTPDPVAQIQTALTTFCREALKPLQWDVEFHRTLRIPDDGKVYPLPAGLGKFPLRLVRSRTGSQLCLPMYSSEAMWMKFSTNFPCAVQIHTGNINAITGERAGSPLRRAATSEAKQNYIVTPRQPWLDGFCTASGIVRQFVAADLGKGQSVEEQLSDAASGGLRFRIYPMNMQTYFDEHIRPYLPASARIIQDRLMPPLSLFDRDFPHKRMEGRHESADLGLAAGGQIRQEIYADTYDPDVWETSAVAFSVNIYHASAWTSLTGEPPPHKPLTFSDYTVEVPYFWGQFGDDPKGVSIPWYDYYRDDLPQVQPSAELAAVCSTGDFEPDNESTKNLATQLTIVGYGNAPRPEKESGIQYAVPQIHRRQHAVEWWHMVQHGDIVPDSQPCRWTTLIGSGHLLDSLDQMWEMFPLIPLTYSPDGIADWQIVQLNRKPLTIDGLRIDGFRFSSPFPKLRNLVWAFEPPQNLFAWLLEVKGKMARFLDTKVTRDEPSPATVYQVAPAVNLGHKGDNMIVFAFRDDRPVDLPFGMAFRDEPFDESDPNRFQILDALISNQSGSASN